MFSRLLSSRLVKAGLILLGVGTGPLLVIIVAAALGVTRDPNPNPIGFGILAAFTFWPSVQMIVVGAVRTVTRGGGGPAAGKGEKRLDAGTPSKTDAASLVSTARSPLGRGLVGMGGALLLLKAAGSLRVEGRGAAAAMVIGVALLWFAATGHIPHWFRR